MGFLDKAKGKVGELAEKAGPGASKGIDAAKQRVDKATGGKYHDQIESVTNKVEGVINKDQNGQSKGDEGSGPGNADSGKPDDPNAGPKS